MENFVFGTPGRGSCIDSRCESGPCSLPKGLGVRPRGAHQVRTPCCSVGRCCLPSRIVPYQAFVDVEWQEAAVDMTQAKRMDLVMYRINRVPGDVYWVDCVPKTVEGWHCGQKGDTRKQAHLASG